MSTGWFISLTALNNSTEGNKQLFCKMWYLHGGLGVTLDKIRCLYELPSEQRIDDGCKQSPVEFGHLYVYFIEIPGGYPCKQADILISENQGQQIL